jgi:hypothetical protein
VGNPRCVGGRRSGSIVVSCGLEVGVWTIGELVVVLLESCCDAVGGVKGG